MSETAIGKKVWKAYAWLPVYKFANLLLGAFEGADPSHGFLSVLAHSFSGPWLLHLLIVDFGLIIPVFLYAYGTRLFGPLFWKVFFCVAITTDISVHVSTLIGEGMVAFEVNTTFLPFPFVIMSYAYLYIYIPAYVALYRYAFHFLPHPSQIKQ